MRDVWDARAKKGEKAQGRTGLRIGIGAHPLSSFRTDFTTWVFTPKPKFSRFQKVRLRRMKVERIEEPQADILQKADKVVVMAKVPGVEEGDLHYEIKDDILNISAISKGPIGEEHRYQKEILLPFVVDEQNVKASLKDGLLEMTLKKMKKKRKVTQ